MKRWLSPMIGVALLGALATPPVAPAAEVSTKSQLDGIMKAAAGLRQLAARALPSNFDQELKGEYTKQTTWLKNAAGRCDALAKKMQAAGSKGASADGGAIRSDKFGDRSAAAEYPNLRSALQKESGEFSFKSPEAKARQEEAKRFIQALQ